MDPNPVEEARMEEGAVAQNPEQEVVIPHRQWGEDLEVKSLGEVLLGNKENVIDQALDRATALSRNLHTYTAPDSTPSSIDSQANILFMGAATAVATLISDFSEENKEASIAKTVCGTMLAVVSADYCARNATEEVKSRHYQGEDIDGVKSSVTNTLKVNQLVQTAVPITTAVFSGLNEYVSDPGSSSTALNVIVGTALLVSVAAYSISLLNARDQLPGSNVDELNSVIKETYQNIPENMRSGIVDPIDQMERINEAIITNNPALLTEALEKNKIYKSSMKSALGIAPVEEKKSAEEEVGSETRGRTLSEESAQLVAKAVVLKSKADRVDGLVDQIGEKDKEIQERKDKEGVDKEKYELALKQIKALQLALEEQNIKSQVALEEQNIRMQVSLKMQSVTEQIVLNQKDAEIQSLGVSLEDKDAEIGRLGGLLKTRDEERQKEVSDRTENRVVGKHTRKFCKESEGDIIRNNQDASYGK